MEKRETISIIAELIHTAEKFKNAYFFNPPANASGRRRYEEQNSISEFEWNDGKDKFTAKYNVVCSCRNVYAKGTYTRNGKPTTLTAVKNSYKRMCVDF